MPKTFPKQHFATASGDFNSVASLNFCTKCLSHLCCVANPRAGLEHRSLMAARRSQVSVGEVRQSLATGSSCDWEIFPVQGRRKRFKCCFKVEVPPLGLGALPALGVEPFLAKFKSVPCSFVQLEQGPKCWGFLPHVTEEWSLLSQHTSGLCLLFTWKYWVWGEAWLSLYRGK